MLLPALFFGSVRAGVDVSAVRAAGAGDQLPLRADRHQAASLGPRTRARVDGHEDIVRCSPGTARRPQRGRLLLQLHRHDRQKTDRENAG